MKHSLQKILCLTAILCLSAGAWAETPKASKATSQPQFAADAYLDHVKYLASDELGGRATGSPGIDLAAEYIVAQYKAAGCEPGGPDGSWFQPFEARMGKKLVDDEARLEVEGLEHPWRVRQDWIPFPFSAPEEAEGPLAFAGYGIDAPAYDYNDYEDFDAEDKVLLMLRYEPKATDPDAEFGGPTPSSHALFSTKVRTAARHGAKAILIVNPPNRDPAKDELTEFVAFDFHETYRLPIVQIQRTMADALLQKAGMPDLKTLTAKLDEQRKSLSKDLGLTVHLRPGIKPNEVPARNILAFIRGTGNTDETIVVGAHFDHLGTRPSTSQPADPNQAIYNGADDNASGTAGVLELAKALKSGPPLRRNVLFISFSGEELGLLGSRHFVQHPTIELEHIRAMVNLDMIGRLHQKPVAIYSLSSAKEFPSLVKQAADEAGLEYKPGGAMPGGSDHASFVMHDIPSVFFFTGVHKQYHQPEDDWQLIDSEGATRVLQMAYALITELGNLESGPTFTEPGRGPADDEPLPKPAIEEHKEAAERGDGTHKGGGDSDEPPSRDAMRVRLGIVPDMVGDDEPGMAVQSVMDGTCAKTAGMQDGDRVVKIADEDIRDIYGYMRALKRFKPGDEIDVVVVRAGEKKTLKVKLDAARPRGEKE